MEEQKLLATSINRNIVECKDVQSFAFFTVRFRINRNIVECKAISVGMS